MTAFLVKKSTATTPIRGMPKPKSKSVVMNGLIKKASVNV